MRSPTNSEPFFPYLEAGDEPVGDLRDLASVEVADTEETFRTTISIGQPLDLSVLSCVEPVPVFGLDGCLIGYSTLQKMTDGESLRGSADVVMRRRCPERLNLEAGTESMHLIPVCTLASAGSLDAVYVIRSLRFLRGTRTKKFLTEE